MAEALSVTLCWSPAPQQVHELTLQVPSGCTVRQALELALHHPAWPPQANLASLLRLSPGIWNRKVEWTALLREGDRMELYRPLRVDPKVARRERFGQQGARRAGLFAKKRPGAAPGY